MFLVKCQNQFCFRHVGSSSQWNLVTISIDGRRIYPYIFLKGLPHPDSHARGEIILASLSGWIHHRLILMLQEEERWVSASGVNWSLQIFPITVCPGANRVSFSSSRQKLLEWLWGHLSHTCFLPVVSCKNWGQRRNVSVEQIPCVKPGRSSAAGWRSWCLRPFVRTWGELVTVIWALLLFNHKVQATDLSDKYFLFLIVPLKYI